MYPPVTVAVDARYLAEVNGFDSNGRSDHGDGYSYGPIEDRRGHEVYIKGGDALDVYVPAGTFIQSAISGVVSSIGIDRYGTMYIIIAGDEGETVDAHLMNLTVNQGDTVTAGQIIGQVSGKLNNPHDHAERFINGRSLMAAEILANIGGGGGGGGGDMPIGEATIRALAREEVDKFLDEPNLEMPRNPDGSYRSIRQTINDIHNFLGGLVQQDKNLAKLIAEAAASPGTVDTAAIAKLVAPQVAPDVLSLIIKKLGV
ncbi:MAG: M23 family metallopeptidase [Actinomycetota bacterium]